MCKICFFFLNFLFLDYNLCYTAYKGFFTYGKMVKGKFEKTLHASKKFKFKLNKRHEIEIECHEI